MLSSLRCGAKTRTGRSCKSPSVHGKKRCRMHGGAMGSGAPRGNKNALKHGRYTRAWPLYSRGYCGTRAHSRTGAASAKAAATDRVTCIADHQAAIGSPAIRQPRPKHADFGRNVWSGPAGDCRHSNACYVTIPVRTSIPGVARNHPQLANSGRPAVLIRHGRGQDLLCGSSDYPKGIAAFASAPSASLARSMPTLSAPTRMF
jgi:hypothetical protein